jgi:hypothetical protein
MSSRQMNAIPRTLSWRPVPPRFVLVGGAVLCMLAGGTAAAQTPSRPADQQPQWGSVQFAPFAGLQFGGAVFAPSGAKASFEAGLDYGATLDVQVAESWRVEVFYSRQEVDLPGVDASVERYMAGVTEERGDGPTRFFGVALVGATRFVPVVSGYGSTALFTIGLGLGVKHLVSDHFGVRAEARGFYAITEAGGGLFCSGGCLFTFSGSGVVQGDLTAGVVLAF